ncbi:MAG: serine hydroxymethyltransferase [Candidatus Woesearchaeota archaeon]
MKTNNILKVDAKIAHTIEQELRRQQTGIELIPSENIASKAVMQAQGSILTNKYSEGLPKKRYYGGNEFIDIIEQLAIDRAKELFHAEHANVQPHSGSNANLAVFLALLQPGDTVLGLKLDHGGHLSHGHPVNISGKLYNIIQYECTSEGYIDYEDIRKRAVEHKPKLIIAGFSAYSHSLDFEKFKQIADEVGAYLLADIAHIAGLVAAKLHPSPFPHCDVVTTTTHKTLRGPRGGLILCKSELAKKIDKAVFPGLQGGPLEHVIAAKAVCFEEALQPSFIEYQKQVIKNAQALCQTLIDEGITVVTQATENHLLLIDLTKEQGTGKDIEEALDAVGIYANKNTIPFDPAGPFNPSGLRIGTPSVTTRGMKEPEMQQIGQWIARIIKNHTNEGVKQEIQKEVTELCKKFPLYTD